jgi:hypothetical protein
MTGAITKIRNCTGTMNANAPISKASLRENSSSPRPLPMPRMRPVRLAKALEVSAGGATSVKGHTGRQEHHQYGEEGGFDRARVPRSPRL